MPETCPESDSAAAVLAAARGLRASADAAEAALLQRAVDWAAMHSVDSITDAATIWDRAYGDTGVTIAGPGAPLVGEFSVAEFAAALGLPTEAGKAYLGEAVELRYRLPRVWAGVVAGDLTAWRARRIAHDTLQLSPEAAGYVDAHVAHVAHKIRTSQLDKLITEAIGRFMPEETERRRREAEETRCFHLDNTQVSLEGTTDVWGTLDLADALDLDAAVTAGAAQLKALGSTESLDVRRAIALGQLARHEQPLDLGETGPPAERGEQPSGPSRSGRTPGKARQVVLYVHLSQAAITPEGSGIGRVENTRSPVTAEQIRGWCANPEAQVVVKPVIDLNAHIHVDAYEIPDRLQEAAGLINHTCLFPWCTRPARACDPDEHAADCDHIEAHVDGGTTCSCNIAPLCRRHHRLKTHSAWTYIPVERGTYLWTSPHGYQYLRNHHGTLDLTGHTPDQTHRTRDRARRA